MSGVKKMDEVRKIQQAADFYNSTGDTKLAAKLMGVNAKGESVRGFITEPGVSTGVALRASGRTFYSVYSVVRRHRAASATVPA